MELAPSFGQLVDGFTVRLACPFRHLLPYRLPSLISKKIGYSNFTKKGPGVKKRKKKKEKPQNTWSFIKAQAKHKNKIYHYQIH
jgi:hypothetical protein